VLIWYVCVVVEDVVYDVFVVVVVGEWCVVVDVLVVGCVVVD